MQVIKRDGSTEKFDRAKIKNAIAGAFESINKYDAEKIENLATDLSESISVRDGYTVEEIQNRVELALMENGHYEEAKSYILYRQQHAEARFIKERIDYMNEYSHSDDNAATASETDALSSELQGHKYRYDARTSCDVRVFYFGSTFGFSSAFNNYPDIGKIVKNLPFIVFKTQKCYTTNVFSGSGKPPSGKAAGTDKDYYLKR